MCCFMQAVNEAVNELLIEEEDFAALRESISTYDNFDQLSLAGRYALHCTVFPYLFELSTVIIACL